LLVNQIVNR